MSVLVVGDFMYDSDEFVKLSRTHPDGFPVYSRQRLEQRPGGAGAVASMLQTLGVEVQQYGNHISRHRKHRVICEGQVISRLDDDLPVPHERWKIDADPELIVVCDHAKNVVTPQFWEWLVENFAGTKILVDPHKSRRLEFYRGAWALLPNREEADCQSVEDAKAVRFPCPAGAVKCDRDGVVARWRGTVEHYPSTAGVVIDSCGAGDALLAGAAQAVLGGARWLAAVAAGNDLAGKKCSWWGAKLLPAHSEVLPQL